MTIWGPKTPQSPIAFPKLEKDHRFRGRLCGVFAAREWNSRRTWRSLRTMVLEGKEDFYVHPVIDTGTTSEPA